MMNEDTLVQQTTADYLETQLGWNSEYAYNTETFGPDGTFGRADDGEIVLTRYLREELEKLNPGLPAEAYENALRAVTEVSASQSTLQTNREKYDMLRNGVKVSYRNKGNMETRTLRVFDFEDAENNHFLVVRELRIKGPLYRRRADIVGFVNGLPLLFMELKNINRNIRRAYDENLSDYKDTVPHLFHFNAMCILGNGTDALMGSYSAAFKFFREWKRLDEDEPGVVDMETLLKGVCSRQNFMDIFENFILFDDSGEEMAKIVCQNQQFLGVNRAIQSVRNREATDGKLGVFWHTQGAGKSYSMVFFTRKVHRKLGRNFTFLIMTDRDDLDGQLYGTYVGTGAVSEGEETRAESGKGLKALLSEHHKSYVFSLIQKFNEDVSPDEPYSDRDDIIVVVDEAHRTQYGRLSLNQRNALPNAHYIAFTGTPLFSNDEITRRVFGDYVSKYGFQRAVEDGATVPLYYDAHGEKLGLETTQLNEKIAEKLEEYENEDVDVQQRLEQELKRDYHIVTAPDRLKAIAKDFVQHYSTAWQSGKAMFVAIDKIAAVTMHEHISNCWAERITELENKLPGLTEEDDRLLLQMQIDWMKETQIAVMISEEQGEVDKFRKWDLDIKPHRNLIKNGFEKEDGKRIDPESAFKKKDHPFRIVIVCAMWLTGFDVKSLSTLYLDKPLKAHTLMQAIARANRVNEGKDNGLIVDYCGILKNLRQALATFAGSDGENITEELDPTRPQEELVEELLEAIEMARSFLIEKNFRLEDIIEKSGFERNAAIANAKEIINENDESRKRFEIIARQVFRKFKACINVPTINEYRKAHDSVNIIYKRLQEDKEKADISQIIKELHDVVSEHIQPQSGFGEEEQQKLYDISAIDFERLQQEFARSPRKNTHVQNLKDAIEKRLSMMIAKNPTRTNFQEHYEELVAKYNQEKDRVTIERTFEALLKLVDDLDEEEKRHVREGLDNEDMQTLFDYLKKDDLKPEEIKQIKKAAEELYAALQRVVKEVHDWQSRQATRDRVKQLIYDSLFSDETGLPECYSEDEIKFKRDQVFGYLFNRRMEETAG